MALFFHPEDRTISTLSPYTGDGATTEFDITFNYGSVSTVKATVDGVEAPFTFINSSRIAFDTAPASGAEIRIFRQTNVATAAVDFADGAIIRADDLDAAIGQSRDRAEELGSELDDLYGRAIKVPAGEAAAGLVTAASRANKLAAWNGDGDFVPVEMALAVPSLASSITTDDGGDVQSALDKRPLFDIRGMVGGDGEIAAALGLVKAAGGRAFIAAGSYTLAAELEIGSFQIEAHPQAIIAPSASFSGLYLLTSTGSFTALPALSGDLSAGGLTAVFTAAHGLAEGDWFIIYDPTNGSFNGARDYYRDGEWCQVREVTDATTVKVSRPLNGGYAAATVEVYRANLNTPSIRGGRWEHGAQRAFLFTGCTGQLTREIVTTGACNQAIYIDRCVNWTAHSQDVFNSGVGGGEDYGIVVGNSQHGRLSGGRVYGRRHGIAMGGDDVICSVPNRDVLATALRIENDPTADAFAADLHGNCSYSGYVDCQIYGGGSIGGLSPIYRGSSIFAGASGIVLSVDEFKGGLVDLRRIEMTTTVINVAGGAGIVEFGAVAAYFNVNTTDDVTLLLEDFVLNAPSLAANEVLVRMDNAGSDAAFSPRIRRGTFLTAGNALRILETNKTGVGGTAASKGIIVEDFVPELPAGSRYHLATGGHYLDFPHRLPVQKVVWDATTANPADVRVVSAGQTFDVPYPRLPHAIVGAPGSQDGSTFDPQLGSATGIGVSYIFSADATSIRLAIRSSDSSNFGVDLPFRVSGTVGLREL